VSDSVDSTIWKVDSVTGALSTFTVGGPLITPIGLTQGPNGNIFVSDFIGNQILEYGPDGNYIGVFASVPNPTNGVFGPNGNFYVTEFLNDQVVELNGSTGALLSAVVPTGTLQAADGLSFGPDGDLYVADYLGNTISRFTPNGTPLGVFISGSQINGVSALTFAPDGTVYVSNSNAMNVLHYSATGAFLDILGSTSPLDPYGTAIFGGALFTGCGCSGSTGELLKFDLTTQAETVLVAPDTPGFNDVEDVMAPTPEPAAWLTLASGLLLFAAARHVRRGDK
jgi:streptogramin lyase